MYIVNQANPEAGQPVSSTSGSWFKYEFSRSVHSRDWFTTLLTMVYVNVLLYVEKLRKTMGLKLNQY